jgi:hypothetical protein
VLPSLLFYQFHRTYHRLSAIPLAAGPPLRLMRRAKNTSVAKFMLITTDGSLPGMEDADELICWIYQEKSAFY